PNSNQPEPPNETELLQLETRYETPTNHHRRRGKSCYDTKPYPSTRSTATRSEAGKNDNHGSADGG
ncbi:hypothetical protein A2U01_0092235, partial [Trifolium medium]|nr:hypothetical protein [Trifolium medium]